MEGEPVQKKTYAQTLTQGEDDIVLDEVNVEGPMNVGASKDDGGDPKEGQEKTNKDQENQEKNNK